MNKIPNVFKCYIKVLTSFSRWTSSDYILTMNYVIKKIKRIQYNVNKVIIHRRYYNRKQINKPMTK